jgi:serine/threonine protein kinase
MAASQQDSPESSSTDEWRFRQEILERYEVNWSTGEKRPIDDFLPSDRFMRPALLRDLVHVELELRLKAGEPARVEDYLARYPELVESASAVQDLIAAEFQLRRSRDKDISLDEYRERFPHYEGLVDRLKADAEKGPEATLPFVAPDGKTLSPADEQPGVVVPRWPAIPGYEILDILGRGGMGVVYKARQIKLKRLVALKMIIAGAHAGPEDLLRFRREAEAVAQLQHPNIVQIYEIGDHAGLPYFSLELVDGGSLADHSRDKHLAPDDAAQLVEILARAMQFAHDRGIIHRDLKPANILLSTLSGSMSKVTNQSAQPGRSTDFGLLSSLYSPKISDFGLAKRLDAHSQHTRSGAIVGTPSYMAPEQATGDVKAVGPAADIYALGAILYALLTGQPPFKADTPLETALKVVTDEPLLPRELNSAIPQELEAICLKCLEKQPHERYENAEALATDLQNFSLGNRITALPVDRTEWMRRWARNLGYDILEELARIGPVQVYKASQVALNRLVALKIIDSSASWKDREGSIRRFRREAEALARLRNPHVVQIYDFGDKNGLLYFSMEFVDGGDLATRLRHTSFTPREAAELVSALGFALESVHEQGVIHRNLKPANILLSKDGETKFCDFGFVRQISDASETFEVAPQAFGSPCYVAPEQLVGRSQDVGPTTDVYGLGAILYELLARRPPFVFSDSSSETLRTIVSQAPVPPSQHNALVPPQLDTICLKCLVKDPRQRYTSATSLGEELKRWLDGPLSEATEEGVARRFAPGA